MKSSNDKIIGFKEIRFHKQTELIYDFIELFPKTRIVCTIRNDLEKQLLSDHFKTTNSEKNKEYIYDYTAEILRFDKKNKNKNNCILFHLEDLSNINKIKDIFVFLGKESSFDCTKITNIIKKKYSTIYVRYKELLPVNFNYDTYKLLNPDLKNMSDFDLMVHYVTYGIKEGRRYMFNIVIMTIVKDEKNNNSNVYHCAWYCVGTK